MSPCGGATVTSLARSVRVSRVAGHSGGRRPSPTASIAPTRLRTIAWQNASAATVATSIPSGSRRHSSRVSVRTVVPSGLRRQYAAKSCSPIRPAAAALSAARSSGRRQASVSWRRNGLTPYGASLTRYAYRRSSAENRASKVAGTAVAAVTRTSAGSTAASRRTSVSPRASKALGDTSTWHT